jgi:hypothetical protein
VVEDKPYAINTYPDGSHVIHAVLPIGQVQYIVSDTLVGKAVGFGFYNE